MNTIKDLNFDKNNPRKHNPRNIGMIEKSLNEVGAGRSIVIDEDNNILAGNGTIEAAQLAGIDKVQIVETDGNTIVAVRRSGLSNEQKKKLALYDNRTAELAEWESEVLKELEQEIDLSDLFTKDELIEITDVDIENEVVEDEIPEVPKEAKTVLGDLYELGEHRLLCGDSTDSDQVAKLMNGEKADMVFTDPPYNVAFNGRSGKFDVIENDNLPENEFEDLIDWFVSILNILQPRSYYVWCNWKFYGILQSKLDFKACIVCAKNVFGLGRGYRHQHEFCLFNGKLDDGINNESDLWQFKKDTNYLHPTQKPIELASRALNNHKQDKLIVDLFSGSGLTFLASHQLKRKCYGMEINPKYCDVIVSRYVKFTGNNKVKLNGKEIEWKVD